MDRQYFKVGDIIIPKKGRKSTNNRNITKLKRAKVVGLNGRTYGTNKYQVTVEILEGYTKYADWAGGFKHAGASDWFFEDALEKEVSSELYPIF